MRFTKKIEGNVLSLVDAETNKPKASFSLSAITGLREILGEEKAKQAIITIAESWYADLSEDEIQEVLR